MASPNQQLFYLRDVPVLPVMRVGTEVDAIIAFVRSATSVALHIGKYRALLDNVCDFCDNYGKQEGNAPMRETDIRVGVLCVAKYEDENWYRSLILDADYAAKTALIYFIDYGNSDYIGFGEILPCHPTLVMYPVQAITVRPQMGPDGLPYTEDELEEFCTDGVHLNVKITQCLVHPADLDEFQPGVGDGIYEAELIVAPPKEVEGDHVDGSGDKEEQEQAEAEDLEVAQLEKHVDENQDKEQEQVEAMDLDVAPSEKHVDANQDQEKAEAVDLAVTESDIVSQVKDDMVPVDDHVERNQDQKQPEAVVVEVDVTELAPAEDVTALDNHVDVNEEQEKAETVMSQAKEVAPLEDHVEANQNQEQPEPETEAVEVKEVKERVLPPISGSNQNQVTVPAKAMELESVQNEEREENALPDVSINTQALTALNNIINKLDSRLLTLEQDQKKDRANQKSFEQNMRDSFNKLSKDVGQKVDKIHETMALMAQEFVRRTESLEREISGFKVANLDLEKLCKVLMASVEAKDQLLMKLTKEKEETKEKMQRTIDELKVQIATDTVLRNREEKIDGSGDGWN